MKSLTRGNFKAAMSSLRQNKWRSFLTMLGIIIGVSSVITVVSIGQGIKHQVSVNIQHVGPNLITVLPARTEAGGLQSLGSLVGVGGNGTLSEKDYEAVVASHDVAQAAPLGILNGTVTGERGTYTAGPVVMTSADFPSLVNQTVGYGAFISQDDGDNNVAVLGSSAATKLFHASVPLGQTFTFRGQQFMVRGVLNDAPNAPLSSAVDYNNAIFISYATGLKLTNGSATVAEVLAKSASPDPQAAIKAIRSNLTRLHGDSQDFSVLVGAQAEARTDRVLGLLTELISGVAAVSLLVGGIGIMNVLLVSVTERQHEIGIRKAVGATDQQIMSEFLSEATVLSVVGSIIGIIVSLAVNLLLRIFTSLQPAFDWQIIVIATLVSIAVGILFGTAPAVKAARKDPITALRGE
ncbi:MAG TPA: ABC transporter permease [Candidatus Saccharimonadales bacterium]|nr:ABC transporter permease [Candidatus Saccharimonadales bacterium]